MSNQAYAYFVVETGEITKVLAIPPHMAEINREPEENFMAVPDGLWVTPDTHRLAGDGSFAPYTPPVDADLLRARLRAERDRRLALCDWTQALDAPLDSKAIEGWRLYRQALRDLPGTVTDLENIQWPVPPGGQAGEQR